MAKKAPAPKPEVEPFERIQVLMPTELRLRLGAEAAALGQPLSGYIRGLLLMRYAGGRDPSPGEL